jgi:hypothetical protein
MAGFCEYDNENYNGVSSYVWGKEIINKTVADKIHIIYYARHHKKRAIFTINNMCVESSLFNNWKMLNVINCNPLPSCNVNNVSC